MSANQYNRPELDLLRLLAFGAVFCFHYPDYAPIDAHLHPLLAALSTVGAFGVAVFFLLSAFLITELLRLEKQAAGQVRIGAFYIRRILRIWPLYFAAFYGMAALAAFLPDVGATKPAAWLAFSTFTGNWYVTLHGWIAGPVDPLWSISVEEQFYLLAPLVVAFCGRKTIAAVCAATLGIAYFVIWRYATHPVAGDNGEWTNGFVQYQFFAAGILLSIALRGRLPAIPLIVRAAGLALGIGCWLAAVNVFGVKSWDAHPVPVNALCGWAMVLLGAIVIFLSVLGLRARYIPAALAYGGRISYGLYVFHSLVLYLVFNVAGRWLNAHAFPVSQAWQTLLAVLATLLAAHTSYRYFEKPFIRLKARFGTIQRGAADLPAVAGRNEPVQAVGEAAKEAAN